ncbi:MAG: hypothetical protein AAGJ08_07880 [Cyanobacteria bacterium P01_H01_bin.35]
MINFPKSTRAKNANISSLVLRLKNLIVHFLPLGNEPPQPTNTSLPSGVTAKECPWIGDKKIFNSVFQASDQGLRFTDN